MKDTVSALSVVTGMLQEARDAKELVRAMRYQVLPSERGIEAEAALQLSIRQTFDRVSALLDRAQELGLISKEIMEEKKKWPGDDVHIVIGYEPHLNMNIAMMYKAPPEAKNDYDFDEYLLYARRNTHVEKSLLVAVGHVEGTCTAIIREATQSPVKRPEKFLIEDNSAFVSRYQLL
jgi:hypothetical protein